VNHKSKGVIFFNLLGEPEKQLITQAL